MELGNHFLTCSTHNIYISTNGRTNQKAGRRTEKVPNARLLFAPGKVLHFIRLPFTLCIDYLRNSYLKKAASVFEEVHHEKKKERNEASRTIMIGTSFGGSARSPF